MQCSEILRRLNEAGVEFVVVGGVAAIIHGSARITFDIDVCVSFDAQNRIRLLNCLQAMEQGGWLPQELDICAEVDGIGEFEDVAAASQWVELGPALRCRVLTLDALLASKRAGKGMHDQMHVYELLVIKSILDRQPSNSPQ